MNVSASTALKFIAEPEIGNTKLWLKNYIKKGAKALVEILRSNVRITTKIAVVNPISKGV